MRAHLEGHMLYYWGTGREIPAAQLALLQPKIRRWDVWVDLWEFC